MGDGMQVAGSRLEAQGSRFPDFKIPRFPDFNSPRVSPSTYG